MLEQNLQLEYFLPCCLQGHLDDKDIVYQKLVKHIDPSPKLVEKLYSKFDELKQEAHNL